jgi:mono/diheme cytochrome c family protein
MKKKLLYVALAIPVLIAAAVGYISFQAGKPVSVPTPPIKADSSPEGIAHGKIIFSSMCAGCHREAGAEHVSGGRMKEVPEFLGEFNAANITLHETAGIGQFKDEDIARVIRYGVRPNNEMAKGMGGSQMADSDIAAVIGYIRSGDPLFAPDPKVVPRTKLSTMGKVVLYLTGNLGVPDRPASGISVPKKDDQIAYGRYLAHDVFDCAGCHTPGFDSAKATGPEAFSGGFEFTDPTTGKPVVSPNLTFHETGLKDWTQEDFAKAVRDGQKKSGGAVQLPMPKFEGLPDADVAAIYAYLKSKPALPSAVAQAK